MQQWLLHTHIQNEIAYLTPKRVLRIMSLETASGEVGLRAMHHEQNWHFFRLLQTPYQHQI